MSDVDAAYENQAERIAAYFGWTKQSAMKNLQALRDYRCWKRIPRCFNGWGVGLCALPNWHDGDCSPMPDMTVRRTR